MAGVGVPAGGARGLMALGKIKKTEGRGSRAPTPRVVARAHPGHQGTGTRVCETEGLSQGLPSRGERGRRASGTGTTPRVGTRALPGLQVVRANNCLTEGLSEGRRVPRGARVARVGEAHAPPAVGVSATAPQPCRLGRVRSRRDSPRCRYRRGRCRLGWCSPHLRTCSLGCVCCSYIQYSTLSHIWQPEQIII